MKKIIIIIISFFLAMNITDALELTCPSLASPNETITCHIEETEYIGLKANYNLNQAFTYHTSSNLTWKKYYENNNGFSTGDILNNNKFSMDLELKIENNIELNKEYEVELTNIEATTKDYEYVKLDNLKTTIKIVSNDNTLKNLEVKDHKLTPNFNRDNTTYKVTTTNESVVINAIPNDQLSTITGDIGEKHLQYGVNNFSINVTSPKGEIKTYYLYITREAKKIDKSSDFTLKELSISKGTLKFDKNTFLYNVNVDYNTENIEVKAIPNSNKATIKIEKPETLSLGKNTISIIVTAEDGTIGKYIIEVTRKDKLSSDASIKNLNIKGYFLDFKPNIYEYELEINNEDKLDIEVVLNDNKAKYKISGNKNLKNKSIITIKITAEDGTINNYKIKIIKKDPTNSISFFNNFKIIPIIIFITLILSIIIIKTIKKKHINNTQE